MKDQQFGQIHITNNNNNKKNAWNSNITSNSTLQEK